MFTAMTGFSVQRRPHIRMTDEDVTYAGQGALQARLFHSKSPFVVYPPGHPGKAVDIGYNVNR